VSRRLQVIAPGCASTNDCGVIELLSYLTGQRVEIDIDAAVSTNWDPKELAKSLRNRYNGAASNGLQLNGNRILPSAFPSYAKDVGIPTLVKALTDAAPLIKGDKATRTDLGGPARDRTIAALRNLKSMIIGDRAARQMTLVKQALINEPAKFEIISEVKTLSDGTEVLEIDEHRNIQFYQKSKDPAAHEFLEHLQTAIKDSTGSWNYYTGLTRLVDDLGRTVVSDAYDLTGRTGWGC